MNNIGEIINTSTSVLGQDLLDWIAADRSTKTEKEQAISSELYHKYVVDREGKPKHKIFPEVYYYVNHNDYFQPKTYVAYIVRDKMKSPRELPQRLVNMDLVAAEESFKGGIIRDWATYHMTHEDSEFQEVGKEIYSKYFDSKYPLRVNLNYFVNRTSRGIKVFRDLEKSPRQTKSLSVDQ